MLFDGKSDPDASKKLTAAVIFVFLRKMITKPTIEAVGLGNVIVSPLTLTISYKYEYGEVMVVDAVIVLVATVFKTVLLDSVYVDVLDTRVSLVLPLLGLGKEKLS